MNNSSEKLLSTTIRGIVTIAALASVAGCGADALAQLSDRRVSAHYTQYNIELAFSTWSEPAPFCSSFENLEFDLVGFDERVHFGGMQLGRGGMGDYMPHCGDPWLRVIDDDWDVEDPLTATVKDPVNDEQLSVTFVDARERRLIVPDTMNAGQPVVAHIEPPVVVPTAPLATDIEMVAGLIDSFPDIEQQMGGAYAIRFIERETDEFTHVNFDAQRFAADGHTVAFDLPESLPAGRYSIVIWAIPTSLPVEQCDFRRCDAAVSYEWAQKVTIAPPLEP